MTVIFDTKCDLVMQAGQCKIVWFTGLSGAGKTTLAREIESLLTTQGRRCRILDGDELRKSMKRQEFSRSEIFKNNERVINLCKELEKDFDFLLVAVIAPYLKTREFAREQFSHNYIEVYVKTAIGTLIERDTKGLYKKALAGELKNLIGVDPSSPYEEPLKPDIIVDTSCETVRESSEKLIKFINQN